MLKAVLFDMDGVIIDSEPIYFEVEVELLKKFGIGFTAEEHAAFVGTVTREMWQFFKDKHNLEHEVTELVDMQSKVYRETLLAKKGLQPIQGAAELIKELAENGIRLAVASSSHADEIDTVIGMFNLKEYFSQIASGDEVENGKPAPDIFLLAAEKLGVKPEECVVIEDSTNGVRAAVSAGMKCIGYKNVNSGNQDLSQADLIVSSLSEINLNKLTRI